MATIRNVLVRLESNSAGFARGFRSAQRAAEKFQTSLGKLKSTSVAQTVRGLGAIANGYKTIGKAAAVVGAVSALGGAAAVSAAQLLQLGAALAPLAGLLAALPAAAIAGGIALATLKIATSGFGDAAKAALEGNQEKFDKALAKMGPAAAGAAKEFKALVPTLHAVRNAAQAGFWTPLKGQMTATAKVLAGPLATGLKMVARQFGSAATDAARFARESRSVAAIKTLFASTARSISGLRPALTPILRGFRDLAVAGAPVLEKIAAAVGKVGVHFGEWMQKFAASGRVDDVIMAAVTVLKQLGTIAKNVGSILGSMFKAAGQSGGGLLGVIGKVTGEFAKFLKSTEGVKALRAIFQGIGAIGTALGPVVIALAQGLGLIAPAIGRIAIAVGPVLAAAINALAPALAALEPGIIALINGLGGAVKVLAPALVPIAKSIGDVAAALAPVVVALAGGLALIAPALARIAIVAAPMVTAVINALAPALAALEPGLMALVSGLSGAVTALAPALVPIAQAIAAIAVGLAPVLPALGQLIAMLALGLAKHITTMLPMLPALVGAIIQLGFAFGGALLDALTQISPYLPDLVKALTDLMIAVIPLLPSIIELALAFVPMIPIITQLVQNLTELATIVVPLLTAAIGVSAGMMRMFWDAVKWVVEKVFGAFKWLYDVLVGHSIIPDLVNGITGWFRNGAQWMGDAVSKGVDTVVRFMAGLPGRIGSAVGNLGGLLWGAGRDVMQGLWNGISSMAGWIAGAIGNLVRNIIPEPIRRVLNMHSPSRVMAGLGVNIAQGLAQGMTATQGIVSRAAEGLAYAATPSFAMAGGPAMATPVGVARSAGSGQQPGIDYAALAGAVVSAMSRAGVGATYLDGQQISDAVSRRTGRVTEQRRRTG